MIYNKKDIAFSLFKHVFLIVWGLLALVPFLWVLISSFRDNTSIFTRPLALPESISFDNFTHALGSANMHTYFINSLVISTATVIVLIFIVSMAAYILTRVIKARYLSSYLLLGLMIPVHALLIPNFITIRDMGLLNNYLGLILIYTAVNISFGFFLMSGFMRAIPKELDEAATIDGAGYFRTYLHIILPVSKPAVATVGTFGFLNSWNELLFALVINTRVDTMTITQGINNLRGRYATDFGLLTAGLLFAIVPVIIMYILLQEHVVKGMTAGAVKG